jgi:hypothetical protein
VALHDHAEPVQVADRQRLIEAEIVFEALDIGLRDVRILQVGRERSARRIAQDPVEDDRDQQQQRDRLQRSADDVI